MKVCEHAELVDASKNVEALGEAEPAAIASKTASNISGVKRPVFVFWREQW